MGMNLIFFVEKKKKSEGEEEQGNQTQVRWGYPQNDEGLSY